MNLDVWYVDKKRTYAGIDKYFIKSTKHLTLLIIKTLSGRTIRVNLNNVNSIEEV